MRLLKDANWRRPWSSAVPEKIVTLTGGSGFVGQILRAGLRQRGYRVRVFDRFKGPLVNLLRRRHLGASRGAFGRDAAHRIGRAQRWLSGRLLGGPLVPASSDDILDIRSRIAARFEGSHAVVHLAGIPHPHLPGAIDADFERINYDGSVNVFEAARSAKVPKFIFASSGQVYGINKPVRVDQFPILESNYLPTHEDGQSAYALMKVKFEQYMAAACVTGGTQGISVRLEYPGFQSTTPGNFYVSTSLENLVSGVACAIENSATFTAESFNVVDGHVDERIVDVQAFLQSTWPTVPNHSTGNESLLGVEKARRLLGYDPIRNGSYFPVTLVW
jgi:nucleoside-diphosphate-sugar epimerase